MNANPKFLASTAQVDEAAVQPLPASRKVYLTGTRPDLCVPMREITQSDTPAGLGEEKNPPLFVYDTSGPYTDPAARIDIRAGLPPLRERWIEERADTVRLDGPSSEYGRGRLADAKLADLRFNLKRLPRRAQLDERALGAFRPAQRKLHGAFHFLKIGRQLDALVELHLDIGTEQALNLDRPLGRQQNTRAVEV